MATSPTGFSGGIQFPVQPGQDGGIKLVFSDDYIGQLISLLASDGESNNPFLEIGIGLTAVFANVSDGGWRAQQQHKINTLFRRLQKAKLAKLVNTQWSIGPGEGEFTIVIRWLSIETSTERDTTARLRRR